MSKIMDSMAYPQLKSFNTQTTFLAYQLLQNSSWDCYLSLEQIGDVGIQGETNKIIELKNADSDGNNPLSNKSINLWKTLYNWSLFFYENKIFDISDYKLYIYIFSTNQCHADIAEKMIKCNSNDKFKKLKQEIAVKVLGKDKITTKSLTTIQQKYKSNDKKNCDFYVESLFSKELNKYSEQVILNFQYKKMDKYYNNIIDLIKRNYGFIDEAECDDIAENLLGWLKRKTDKLLDTNSPIIIHTSEFRDFSQKYIAPKMMPNKYKAHYQLIPSDVDINAELVKCPNYINQLKLINLDNEPQELAAYYYLKLLLERKNWINSGFINNITDQKYISCQQSVIRDWKISKSLIDSSDEIEHGQKTYRNFLNNASGMFDGEQLDKELIRGFIEELANIDVKHPKSIGWHPRYKELLNNNSEEDK